MISLSIIPLLFYGILDVSSQSIPIAIETFANDPDYGTNFYLNPLPDRRIGGGEDIGIEQSYWAAIN